MKKTIIDTKKIVKEVKKAVEKPSPKLKKEIDKNLKGANWRMDGK